MRSTILAPTILVTLLALVAWVAPRSLHAVEPTELFFSEYVEGSGNNKALEIFNGTSAAIDLAADGYNVQMFFNGSATAGLTINLTGTVATGGVFVLAHASAAPAVLALANQTNGGSWFNGDDAVVLRRGTTVIDVIGQVGVDPGSEWGSGLASTLDNTIRRSASTCVGDADGSDPFDPAGLWDGLALDTFDGLGLHTTSCTVLDAAPRVTATYPANGAADFPVTADLTVTFSEPVAVSPSAFALNCSITGPVALTVVGGPTIITLHPAVPLATGEVCALAVFAAHVSDVDVVDPPDAMAADVVITFSPADACLSPVTSIGAIQGPGTSAAITGLVSTRGVVVGDFEGSAGLGGFYLQDPLGDGDPQTSDGIFVYTGSANTVAAGDLVRVAGYARERFNQTTINGADSNTAAVPIGSIVRCGTGSVSLTDVTLPFASSAAAERFEGMLVRMPQPLVISDYADFDRFGEIELTLPRVGESRLYTPTAVESPGAPAVARALDNARRRITLDDGLSTQNPVVLRHPNGRAFSLANRFRGGDIVQNTVGVLGFDFGVYRIEPTGPADYVEVNPRPGLPGREPASVRVASMNTLNYFITPNYPSGHPLHNTCGALRNLECRGYDADQAGEIGRQRDKLLSALLSLDADIIGLNEIENTPGVEPLGDAVLGLVSGLNALLGAGSYAYVDTGVVGTDAIRVGLIYRPAAVTPVGQFAVLDSTVDPRFLDTKNRPSMAQTFESVWTGGRFTVVVNHFKSKGSACTDVGDPDVGDGQGNCNQTRAAAGRALVDWMATDPTRSGDPDVLVVGDLNSYAREDPVTAIRQGADRVAGTGDDFLNLVEWKQGAGAYSYAFDAQVGYLDHALASISFLDQVVDATELHINADEPDVLDYDTSFKPAAQEALYEPNGFRSSDHDPVVVTLMPIRTVWADGGGFFVDPPFAIDTVDASGPIVVPSRIACDASEARVGAQRRGDRGKPRGNSVDNESVGPGPTTPDRSPRPARSARSAPLRRTQRDDPPRFARRAPSFSACRFPPSW